MHDVKITSEQPTKFAVRKTRGNARSRDLKTADDVQGGLALEVPAFQAGIKNE
jgi:hypothetical protein